MIAPNMALFTGTAFLECLAAPNTLPNQHYYCSNQMKKLRTVDLFCGCGGMSLGFQNAGFHIVASYDNWQPAVDVYNRNFAHTAEKVDLGDPSVISAICKHRPEVIVGGPPCQDFSSAGAGKSDGHRANLTAVYASIIREANPNYFVFENVPRARLSDVYQAACVSFRDSGYGLTEVELDAAYCGVPQTRKRLFLIGGLGEANDFLRKRLLESLAVQPLTMRQYFGNALDIDYYFRVPTNYSRRGVFSVDAPCTTVRAIDRPIPKGYLGHKDDPVDIRRGKVRGLSVAERARVQTFPENFVLVGNKTNLNTMIGNAVPVNLANHVAKALLSYSNEKK